MKKQLVLRPYIFNKCTEFCLQLCQNQGWFEDKTPSDITAEICEFFKTSKKL